MSKRSTFSAHLSVKHGALNKMNVDRSVLVETDQSDDLTLTHCNDDRTVAEQIDYEMDHCNEIDNELYIRNFALFFLKLQCRFIVPVSTVNVIANEIDNLHQLGLDRTMHALRARLIAENLTVEAVNDIVREIRQADIFKMVLNSDNGILRSQHKRKAFFEANFRYVDPIQQCLGENEYGKLCSFHYIPVKQTLTSMIQEKTVAQCLGKCGCAENGIYTDLHDGSVYNKIEQTVGNGQCSFIELVLYQDAFEVVNPLGSAKKLHKVVAVYMTLANLPIYARNTIDNLQLVMLCREMDVDYFGQEQVFKYLVTELCDLEKNGLLVDGKVFTVRLVCVLGDNLGSHWLGGFSTNFSRNNYVMSVLSRTANR